MLTMPAAISESISDTAVYIQNKKRDINDELQKSNALGQVAKGTLQKLVGVFQECAHLGWDGYDAKPISQEVVCYAVLFLKALPVGIEAPEVGAEPDGAITLEWYRSPRRVISISINPDGRLYYAALIGSKARHGKDFALSDLSQDLSEYISEVIR
jgi:hypothetical protein